MCKYKSLFAFFITLNFICIAAALSKDSHTAILGADELISKIEGNYGAYDTFKSRFEQIYIGRNFSEIRSAGTVYFKKPGMMKWLYDEPHKKTIASYGTNLWIYDSRDSQVILDRDFRRENLPSALSFLWGDKGLGNTFTYRILSVQSQNKQNIYTLELIPKEDLQNVDRIHFVISSGDFLVRETSVFDPFGNENRLIFSHHKLGSAIKDSFFDFKPPKGALVVEPPKRLER